jgi:hypothetical protein
MNHIKRLELTSKQTILIMIQSLQAIHVNPTVPEIAKHLKLLGVGFKPAENEIRARLGELQKTGDVTLQPENKAWILTDKGVFMTAGITAAISDEELARFTQ